MKNLSVVILFPALVLAGTVSTTVTLSPSELLFGRHADYDLVQFGRGVILARPGEPAVPELPVTCVIPAGARLTGVKVEPLEWSVLPGTYTICPAQQPRPVSSKMPVAWTAPDPAAYSRSAWPAEMHREPTQGKAGGFALVSVTVAPLRWLPESGRLELCRRLLVTFEYEAGPASRSLTKTQAEILGTSLIGLLANPSDIGDFAPPTAELDGPEVTCLVVTAERLADEFAEFCNWRTARGIRTEVRTMEWVERNYTGRDPQEKLRNAIRDFHERRGLVYVVLAGDNALVPSRRIHVRVGQERGEIPTDLYYADLDWSWDSNNNNMFGEMSDSVDFYADVLVGRASVDRPEEAQAFFGKLRTYEADPDPDYVRRALLPSGWLWRSIGYHGRIVNDSIANLTPPVWQDIHLVNPSGAAVVAESLERGFALFDPAGHGNEGGVYDEDGTPIYTSSYARTQRGARRYSIMTSLACTPGNFEFEDCIAELAHNNPQAGCIAVMMNSRYGWGTPPSFGPSEKLCARFFDFLFARGQTGLGACHSRSREEYAGIALYDQLWRWCMTEFNLFGDPAMDIWTAPPAATELSTPDSILTGSREVVVSVSSGGRPVPGALVCALKPAEVFVTARTDASGTAVLLMRPGTPGELTVTATVHDFLPAQRAVRVGPGSAAPWLTLTGVAIEDSGQPNPNGVLEPGETGRLMLTVRNTGNLTATNARLALRALSGGIALSDSLVDIGSIPAGDSLTVSAADVTASPSVLPGSKAEFELLLRSTEGDWESDFALDIGWPGRTVAEVKAGQLVLSVTARGTIGWDRESIRPGRGLRFPATDTSSLRTASFVFADNAGRVVDRFYSTARSSDTDWALAESVHSRAPLWGSTACYTSAFSDAAHPDPRGILVYQRALSIPLPEGDGWVALVYDIHNTGPESLISQAGVLADFDVRATDRFHDIAGTLPDHGLAWMRNVQDNGRWVGLACLSGPGPAVLACIDHARYVNPDSALTDDMKFRILCGRLGSTMSDRPFDWTVAVGVAPFALAAGGRQRVAFALVGGVDSLALIDACRRAHQWYDTSVGILDNQTSSPTRITHRATVARGVLRLAGPSSGLRHATLVDASGRHVIVLKSGTNDISRLPAGVYFVRTVTDTGTAVDAVRLVR